ncbi:MAG: hypothetical protein JXX29_16890 [Deltaproteobacteria bacterium]|nr:hypothetical protein [Deltaproteobacteria bacterium]MBN2673363.1 hypothetical protein [Deltaproteobacteria bacterium]
MTFRMVPLLIFVFALPIFAGCDQHPSMTPAETALHLLSMHGLLGKTPGERSKAAKETLASEAELNDMFVDLNKYDKFTRELFTGIVIGAIARHQSKLLESKKKKTAIVTAGQAAIYFVLVDNTWKISLEKTIPDELKAKAKIEKARYEAAKAAGEAAVATGQSGV